MSKSISKVRLKQISRKDGLGLDIRFGEGHEAPGLESMALFIRDITHQKGWYPRVYIDRDGTVRLKIDTIITDTSQGLNFRGLVRTWTKRDSDSSLDAMLAYYISAGGGGYDMLAASTRGIKVYDNDDTLVELGDHCDLSGRPTLDAFVQAQGWRQVV
jgi:hypothetical protein